MGHPVRPYTDIKGFGHVYLEDSWVLGITARPGQFELRLELVLTESHPAYAPPLPGEQYCYRRGRLQFLGVKQLTWEDQGAPAARDASEEPDYGNIDTFAWDDQTFHLEGSWGRACVHADRAVIELDP